MMTNLGQIRWARIILADRLNLSSEANNISRLLVRKSLVTLGEKSNAGGVSLPARALERARVFEAPLGGYLKRGLDIVIASLMLISLAPILIMIALIIYFTMGRPIFFGHESIGYNGIPFRCYKFRTMVTDAKERLALYLANNPAAAAEWQATQKLKDDPRVTRYGQLLRKSSLDELPQLINTLRGEMTCVGPRPVTADELRRYGPSARHYLRVRPGLTGLWQVSGRSNTSYRYRVVLDRTYVTSWSISLDVQILLKTAPALFRLRDSA
jgi:exopolysaccharide production protein ExoY